MKNQLLIFLFALCFAPLWSQEELKTENVFLITLDGLRWQELFSGAVDSLISDKEFTQDTALLKSVFWVENAQERRERLMPFFWTTIAREGQIYGNRWHKNFVNCSNKMWFSYPGYNEILTGAADDERIHSNDKIQNPNVNILEYFNRMPEYKDKVAAFGSWDVFPFIINEERSGVPVNAGFEEVKGKKLSCNEKTLNKLQREIPSPWGSVRLDGFTQNFALEYLKKNHPKLFYIAYGETDDFAHDGKYDQYLWSARRTDSFIRELWEYVQSHPKYKNKTTFIITTDHGRGHSPKDTWKHHGIKIKDADEIWFAVIGPDTPASGEMKNPGQLYQNQVAATVAAFLGKSFSNGKTVAPAVKSMFP